MDKDVRQYIAEIRKIPMVSLDEELKLKETIQAGRRAAEKLAELEQKCELGLITPDEYPHRTREVKKAIRAAADAKQRLVEGHMLLAYYLTNKYGDENGPMMDLIQEANLALIRAAENWDVDATGKGRFLTYATVCIKGALTEAKNKRSVVYIPGVSKVAARRISLVASMIQETAARAATPERIAAELNLPLDTVKRLLDVYQAMATVSLDAPLSDEDDGATLQLFLKAENGDPEIQVTRREIKETVATVLASLTPIEEKVIRYRFGFVDGSPHEYEEVADACHLTLQEERRVEVRAMLRLRHPSRSLQLARLL